MLDIANLEFQRLDLAGLKSLVGLAIEEGWNPGPHDADAFWSADPEGFYGFYHENELIAGGAIVSYEGAFGFMGLFIVKQDYRAQGIGRKLWYKRRDMLLSRLKEGASIGMDGVVAMQPFYQEGGFELAFRDQRYEKIGLALDISPQVSPIEEKDIPDILRYDEPCFGVPRHRFMQSWLSLPDRWTFKYSTGNEIQGYAVVRKVSSGYKIGPLFADHNEIAEALYRACLNAAVGEPVYFDIPLVNQEAVNIVKKYNAKYVLECGRMYYSHPPEIDMKKVYGITTFELG